MEINQTQTEVIENPTVEVVQQEQQPQAPTESVQPEVQPEPENAGIPEMPQQPQAQPVNFLGAVRLQEEEVFAVGTAVVSHTLSMLTETGAEKNFESFDSYKNYLQNKIADLLYVILPAGAVSNIAIEKNSETGNIDVGLNFNTIATLEVYSDRQPVTIFVKKQQA